MGLKFQPWVRADVIYVIYETSYFDSLENYGNYGHSYKKLDDTVDRAFERNIYRFKSVASLDPLSQRAYERSKFWSKWRALFFHTKTQFFPFLFLL